MPPIPSSAARGEDQVDAHLAHVEVAHLGPAELLRIEVEGAVVFAGVEFVPADMAGRHARDRRLIGAGRAHQHKGRALRVGDDGEAADFRNVGRLAVHRAARLLHARGGGIDVLGVDVADPAGRRAHRLGLLGKQHQAGNAALVGVEDDVVHAGTAERLGGPSDDVLVKCLGGGDVGRHQLVPEETRSHVASPLRYPAGSILGGGGEGRK